MAKEFKDWDKVFKKDEISECRHLWLGAMDVWADKVIIKWHHASIICVWTNAEIRHCVYEAEAFRDWQLFRVSMKGLTTAQKLYMLGARYKMYVEDETLGYARCKIEQCRIDNYVG